MVTGRILHTNEATGQLRLRESTKRANKKNQASLDYATRHEKSFVFRDLQTSPYVFVCHDAVGGPLQPPYDGPYQVVHRGTNTFTLKINDKNVVVSIDRLKPAFLINENIEHHTTVKHNIIVPPSVQTEQSARPEIENNSDTTNRYVTRSGRRIRISHKQDSVECYKLSNTNYPRNC